MILRISLSLSPLQSPKSAIFSSIFLDAFKWSDDLTTALRGFAAFADFSDVLSGIAFHSSLGFAQWIGGGVDIEWVELGGR